MWGGGVLANGEDKVRILRRHALEIAAQLPEDIQDALTVLAIARSAVEHVESIAAANDENQGSRGVRLKV